MRAGPWQPGAGPSPRSGRGYSLVLSASPSVISLTLSLGAFLVDEVFDQLVRTCPRMSPHVPSCPEPAKLPRATTCGQPLHPASATLPSAGLVDDSNSDQGLPAVRREQVFKGRGLDGSERQPTLPARPRMSSHVPACPCTSLRAPRTHFYFGGFSANVGHIFGIILADFRWDFEPGSSQEK